MEIKPFLECTRDPKTGKIVELIRNINPQPKQMEVFNATTRYVAYGGARGGGKSWSVRGKALACCLAYRNFRCLIVRCTNAELQANHIEPLLKEVDAVLCESTKRSDMRNGKAICTFSKEDKALHFFNGSKIVFGYCDTDDDTRRYQGQEYDFVFIDEATHFTEFQFHKLSEVCRGANGYPKRIYLTCNPGGVGHGWVKRLFIDRNYYENEFPNEYTFIRASVYDNQILLEHDPGYLTGLKSLPDDIRKADLEGDWNIYEGQFFKEFNPKVHVVEPYAIPAIWPKFRSLDYGLDMLACYWHAVKPNGDVVTYREVHVPDLLPSDAAKLILDNTPRSEQIIFTYAPPDLWARTKDRGMSVVEQFFKFGIDNIVQADNNRVAGWVDMKEWLKVQEDEQGRKYSCYTIFDICRNLIENIPMAQSDEKNPSDMAKEPHNITHALDAVRYFFRSRPAPLTEEHHELTVYEQFFGRSNGNGDGYGDTYDGYGEEI